MRELIGWTILILGGALYIAQLISSINFRLAQRLGIQEAPEESDPLLQRSERYTAYWDLITIGWLPLAGALMIMDHGIWPIVALVGGSIYLDAAGREAAKNLCFRHEGVRIGSEKQRQLFFASYLLMAVITVIVIAYALNALTSNL